MAISLDAIIQVLEGENLTPAIIPDSVTVYGGYCSDLLSDVMGNAGEGQAWITIMKHMNVIAVASLRELPAIVLTGGQRPEQAVLDKATDEDVAIVTTPLRNFEACGRIHALLRGY